MFWISNIGLGDHAGQQVDRNNVYKNCSHVKNRYQEMINATF